jgi:hypothetical protein
MKTTLTAIRLERTRDVVREIARSMSRALPIAFGVAGPLVLAVFAMLAWSGLPVMKAPTMRAGSGAVVWAAQTLVVAWPLWALRRRLLPPAWCVQLRCLPIGSRAMWVSDLEVAAVVLAPIALAYLTSAVFFSWKRAEWWLASWPVASASAVLSWAGSCVLGALALSWQRRSVERGHPAHAARATPGARRGDTAFPRLALFPALLWSPSWRGAMAPGGASLLVGAAVAIAAAVAWVRGTWPVVPGAAWAFAFSALLVALTERAQRAVEGVVDAMSLSLRAWPVVVPWRLQARMLPVLPMIAALATLVALVLGASSQAWRAVPLAGFVVTTLATHLVMVHVPASNREAHVSLWALGTGLATAFGSELW